MSLAQLAKRLLLSVNVIFDIGISNGSGNDKTVKRLLIYKKSIIRNTSYVTPNAKVVFMLLRKVFTKVLIVSHFNPNNHI